MWNIIAFTCDDVDVDGDGEKFVNSFVSVF